MKPRYCLAIICCLVCAMTATAAEFLGKVAFLRDGNLWVQDVPDGTARQITTSGKAAYPVWSASGRWLSYNDDTSTYVVDVAKPQNPRKTSAEFLAAAWSPTEDVLAYTRSPGGLFLTYAGKWEEKLLIRDLPNTSSAIENFVWSPDGKQIAFVRTGMLGQGKSDNDRIAELFCIGIDDARMRRLLRVTGDGYRPIVTDWTSDGKYILFLQDTAYSASLLADGVPLAAVPAAGGLVRVFTANTPVFGGLSISPDGRRIAVIQRSGRESWQNARLFISPVDWVSLHLLTDKTVAPLFPAWSPQGNLLAYVMGPAAPEIGQPLDARPAIAKRHILLVNPATGVRQDGTYRDDFRDEYPLWSADGRHFLFARITPKGQADVWVMNWKAGTQRRVVERISTNEPESGWTGFYGTVNWPAILGWWPGRRMAEGGLLIDRRAYVPLRAVVEALGGTVDYRAETHTVTVALNGKTFTRTLGSDARYMRLWNTLWMNDGTLYAPLILLRYEFDLVVEWNGPALEAVVINSPASRILIIPTQTAPNLRAPVRGVFPLANAGAGEPYLIGGAAGRKYLGPDTEALFLRGGERYTLYTLTGRLGAGRGTRPTPGDSSTGQFLTFTPKSGKPAYALAAPWNAQPRRPALDAPGSAVNRRMMREVLDARGLAGTAPKVDQAVVCDIDDDGNSEHLISASTDSMQYIEFPAAGYYSFVAIRQHGRTRVISGEFVPQESMHNQPFKYRLAGLLDVDGDRRQEVIVHYDWYEGAGEIVYRVEPDAITVLYQCYTGL